MKRQEWGIHTVIVNKRGNPYPKCLPFVGKVLIDDVWSGGTGAEASESGYGLMSSAISAGLYHPRCKDSHTTYFPGISTLPDDKFSHNELKKIEKQNRKEAKERYAERQAKKFGRLERYSLDAQNKEKYGIKSKEWNKNIEKDTSSSIIKDEDLKNIYDYMSFNSYILNEKLRNNMTLSDAELETINRLEKTLDKLSNYKGNLQRSLYFTREEDIEPFLQDYKIGSNIQYKEFLSTTKGEMHNPEGQVQIFIQDAEKGKDISAINEKEQEVLYKRNSEFEVVNMVKNQGKYYILLGEIK